MTKLQPLAPAWAPEGPVTVRLASPRRRILIVDDERINRAVLCRQLEGAFDVVQADSGASAMALAQSDRIDLVVMDIRMPGLNGFEATAALKQAHPDRYIPVVLMTATNEESELVRGLAVGADDFLTKPVSAVMLKAKIAALLRVADGFTTIREQRDQLTAFRARAARDYAAAERIFTRIARRGLGGMPSIEHHAAERQTLDGHLMIATPFSEGVLRVLLGDFSGHGLAAAVAALPVSEVVHQATAEAQPIGVLARALNRKIRDLFAEDVVLSAVIADVHLDGGEGAVWNGGFPDAFVLSDEGRVVKRLPTSHLPLGAADDAYLSPEVAPLQVASGESLLLFTSDAATSDRMQQLVEPLGPSSDFVGDLERALRQQVRSSGSGADASFVRITNDDLLAQDLALALDARSNRVDDSMEPAPAARLHTRDAR